MPSSSPNNDINKKTTSHESGALPAWGAIAGGAVGALIGLIFGKALIGAFILASIGWVGGALVERAKR